MHKPIHDIKVGDDLYIVSLNIWTKVIRDNHPDAPTYGADYEGGVEYFIIPDSKITNGTVIRADLNKSKAIARAIGHG